MPQRDTPPSARSYLTPPEYAAQLGVDPAKVLGWIERGELDALNCATTCNGRPRWRISRAAIADFERRRAARPAPRRPRRRKRAAVATGDYF